MSAGRTLAEREHLRQHYIDEAVADAKLKGMTMRCRNLQSDLGNANHQFCRGESKGGVGCLCRCHDASAVTVATPGG